MRHVIAVLALIAVLAACAAGTGTQDKQGNCPPETIVILNENTGRYDCISEAEYEKILDELDEVRW